MIIDKLLYLLGADSTELVEALDDADKKAKETEKGLGKVEEKGQMTFKQLSRAALGWVAVLYKVKKAFDVGLDFIQEIDALDALSAKTGMTVTDVDALSRSINSLGGKTHETYTDLQYLSRALGREGKEGLDSILALSDKVAGMSYSKAAAELYKYRVTSKATIDLLRKGREEVQRSMTAQKRAGAITEEAAQKAREYNLSMAQFRLSMSDSTRSIAMLMLPALVKLAAALAAAGKWANENRAFVVGFITAISTALLAYFVPAMISSAVAAAPFIAVGAAIAAAALLIAAVFDDLFNFLQGNDSVMGDFFEQFPIVLDLLKWWFDGIKSVFTDVYDLVVWLWDGIGWYIEHLASGLKTIGKAGGWIAKKLGFGGGDVDVNTTETAKHYVNLAGQNPMVSTTTGAIHNASASYGSADQNISIGEISIETQATDARGVAGDIGSELQAQLQRMQANNATAITR